jgi:DNA primase
MNGAKAPIDKTDWSPLKGKRVIIWPDHDVPGLDYARKAASAAARAGALSVEILKIPPDKPAKWDAADAVAEGLDIQAILSKIGSGWWPKKFRRRAKPCNFTALPSCSEITAPSLMI